MTRFFVLALNNCISAGWLIIAIALARPLLKKAPKYLFCFLWALVAIRLILPYQLESHISILPQDLWIKSILTTESSSTILVKNGFIPFITWSEQNNAQTPSAFTICRIIWLAGAALLLLYAVVGGIRLRLTLRTAVRQSSGIWLSEAISAPFVLGIFVPRIYMPFGIPESDTALVAAHELSHIKYYDYILKPFGFVLLALYWFNPLVWLAYALFCRDLEGCCDQRVLGWLDDKERLSYARAIVRFSTDRRRVNACPLAFGETGALRRVKDAMSYRKQPVWASIASVFILLAVAACFLTTPRATKASVLDLTRRMCDSASFVPIRYGIERDTPLDDTERSAIIRLMSSLDESNITENVLMGGTTPEYGIAICYQSQVFHLNEAGTGTYPGWLALHADGRCWWIENAELTELVQEFSDTVLLN